jgi:hypothetical protein
MDEMELLEQFCAEQPPPDPRRLQVARNQVTRQITASHARRAGIPCPPGRPARPPQQLRYAPRRYALAAGIVTAIVIGLTAATTVLTTGPGRPSAGPAAPAIGTRPAGDSPSSHGRRVQLAVYILRRAAAAALAAPQPRANQYIYTGTRQLPGQAPALVQTWQSPDGRRGPSAGRAVPLPGASCTAASSNWVTAWERRFRPIAPTPACKPCQPTRETCSPTSSGTARVTPPVSGSRRLRRPMRRP